VGSVGTEELLVGLDRLSAVAIKSLSGQISSLHRLRSLICFII
jgi:hypothetical protein